MRASTILSLAVVTGAATISLAAPVASSSGLYAAKHGAINPKFFAHSANDIKGLIARMEPDMLDLAARRVTLEHVSNGAGIVSSLVSTAHEIYDWVKGKRSMNELEDIFARAEPEVLDLFARRVTLDHVSNGVSIVSTLVNTAHDIYNWVKGKRSMDELEDIFARADPEILDLVARRVTLGNVSDGVNIVSTLVSTAHQIYDWAKGKRSEEDLHAIFARADPEVLELFARAGRLQAASDGVNIVSSIVNTAHEIYDWVKGKRELEEMLARSYNDMYQREYVARSLYDLD